MLKVILCILYISYWCSEHTCIPALQRLRPFAAVSRLSAHDDVIKWKHFPRNWPFVRGIRRFPVNSPHKGQWRGALMFSLICVWIHDWVYNREAGDLRRYRAHYDVIVMRISIDCQNIITFELNTPYNPLIFNSLFSKTVSWPNHKLVCEVHTEYPKKYAHGFCFGVLCCGYTLTDFPISIRLTSLALWQSNDCPSASKATLMNMDKYFMCIHYEGLHNHYKAKHNKTVCIFLGIYSLRWRHNDHTGVSNHQPHGRLLNRFFRRRSKKTSKLRVTGLCAGNSPGPVNSPHKGPVTRKMFPFDDVIMCMTIMD